jgi:hypothetical protein
LVRGVEDEVDEFGHKVVLAIDFHREIWKAGSEGLRSPMTGLPIIQGASDDYGFVAVEAVFNEVLIGRAVKPGNCRLES